MADLHDDYVQCANCGERAIAQIATTHGPTTMLLIVSPPGWSVASVLRATDAGRTMNVETFCPKCLEQR